MDRTVPVTDVAVQAPASVLVRLRRIARNQRRPIRQIVGRALQLDDLLCRYLAQGTRVVLKSQDGAYKEEVVIPSRRREPDADAPTVRVPITADELRLLRHLVDARQQSGGVILQDALARLEMADRARRRRLTMAILDRDGNTEGFIDAFSGPAPN